MEASNSISILGKDIEVLLVVLIFLLAALGGLLWTHCGSLGCCHAQLISQGCWVLHKIMWNRKMRTEIDAGLCLLLLLFE